MGDPKQALADQLIARRREARAAFALAMEPVDGMISEWIRATRPANQIGDRHQRMAFMDHYQGLYDSWKAVADPAYRVLEAELREAERVYDEAVVLLDGRKRKSPTKA